MIPSTVTNIFWDTILTLSNTLNSISAFVAAFTVNAQKNSKITDIEFKNNVKQSPEKVSKAELIIGVETNLNLGYPVYPSFEYSYTQSIYLQSEVGVADIISKIWYDFEGSTLEHSNNWTIYIGHTTKTQFDNENDWVDVSTLTEVYSGIFANPETKGWIEFDITDFSYNGTDNLIIAVDENSVESDPLEDNRFYSSSVNNKRSIIDRSDSDNIDPASPTTNAEIDASIPNIKLFKGAYPVTDASITEIVSPVGFNWIWDIGTEDIIISLQNKGISNLKNAVINWSVNGTAQTPFNWSGDLIQNASENVAIGTYDFSSAKNYTIEVETVADNDGNPANNAETTIFEILDSFTSDYSADFDDFLYPNTPDYWTLETNVVAWIVDDRISRSGENSLRTFYDEKEPKDDWAFTPYINLDGGRSYSITFWVHAPGWNDVPESLEFHVGTEPNSTKMIKKIWSDDNLLEEEWKEATATFIPATSGNYIFGWHANTLADVDDIAIDDFSILAGSGINTLVDSNISIYPNPSKGTLSVNTKNPYNLQVLNITGKCIIEKQITENTVISIDKAGIYFLRFTNTEATMTKKLIIE